MLGSSFIFNCAFLSYKNTIKMHQCDTETRGEDPQQGCIYSVHDHNHCQAKRAMSKHASGETKWSEQTDGTARYRWVDKLTIWQGWWLNHWLSPSNFQFLLRWDFGGYSQLINLSLPREAYIYHAQAWDRGLRRPTYDAVPLYYIVTCIQDSYIWVRLAQLWNHVAVYHYRLTYGRYFC